jgi:uncharacterized membrane protein
MTRKLDVISVVVIAGTLAITAALYARLPARIPIHFDIHGRADGFAAREIGAWLLPLFAVVTAIVIRFAPRLMRRDWRQRMEGSPTAAVVLIITVMMCALHLVVLRLAIAPETDAAPLLAVVLGVTWFALGQLMPRTRRNPLIGVRTRWTMASDENWARTHRVAGLAFTVGGLVAIIAAAIPSMAVAVIAILASGAVPIVWTMREKRKTA